jgi:hypothetical protein
MFKKSILFLLLFIANMSYAETCPTPEAIKAQTFTGWEALDVGSHTPITAKRLKEFQQSVTMLEWAAWQHTDTGGIGLCYYYGKQNSSTSLVRLDVMLEKKHISPNYKAGGWEPFEKDVFICREGVEGCQFIEGI